ncbi:MAG TPA: DUF6231 family protein [Gammaproteobacteria bacterium]|nr:DUF6231 family protein [Gammaproteobacteria bacterium]
MAPDYRDDIDALLSHLRPRSLLLIGTGGRAIVSDYLADCADCQVEVIDLEDLPDGLAPVGRFEFALVSGMLETLDKASAAMVLARLRDLHAERLLLLVPMDERGEYVSAADGWAIGDLLSYGLYRAGAYEVNGRALHVYTFDLYDYKPTPDWLNSRYWAHPELFDKFWW